MQALLCTASSIESRAPFTGTHRADARAVLAGLVRQETSNEPSPSYAWWRFHGACAVSTWRY